MGDPARGEEVELERGRRSASGREVERLAFATFSSLFLMGLGLGSGVAEEEDDEEDDEDRRERRVESSDSESVPVLSEKVMSLTSLSLLR